MKQKAYIGIVNAKSGLLIGGVAKHQSTPFKLRSDAEKWVDVIVESNKKANRVVGLIIVKPCLAYRPI